MAKFNDLTGQRFGKLTVIEYISAKDAGKPGTAAYWRCKCDCGGETVVRTHDLIHAKIKSCGCYRPDTLRKMKIMVEKEGFGPIEQFRAYLCEKYQKNCFTSPIGKCPLANEECWNFMSFRELYNSRNFMSRKELMCQVAGAIDKEGYELQPNG